MKVVLYASAAGSFICYVLDRIYFLQLAWSTGISQILDHYIGQWAAVKHILEYNRRKNDYTLIYHSEVIVTCYTNSSF
jgi:hypothetical protein